MSDKIKSIANEGARMRKRRQVSQEDVEVLAALLVAFPQISRVTFDPVERGLSLAFLCQGPVSELKREQLRSLYLQSIDVYLSLAEQKSSKVCCYWETIDEFHSFHVERDVASLSTSELSLTVSLVAGEVPVISDLNEPIAPEAEFSWSSRLFLQEILERVRELKCPRKLVALREGERVIVFHK